VTELNVSNGYFSEIKGLGKFKKLSELSVKRVTKAVRAHLRHEFGKRAVSPSVAPRGSTIPLKAGKERASCMAHLGITLF
jgi:hypothetical protein